MSCSGVRRSTALASPFGRIEQVNLTETYARGAVRGMHAESMTKLVTVAHGRACGIYVDARPDSPTFGIVDEVDLAPGVQVLVPSGVANGFQALAPGTQYAYCFDREWSPDDARHRVQSARSARRRTVATGVRFR